MPPLLVTDQPITDLPFLECAGVVGEDALHQGSGARSGKPKAAHVADVENACRRSHCLVLGAMLVYCTGMSQPAKSTMRAQRQVCVVQRSPIRHRLSQRNEIRLRMGRPIVFQEDGMPACKDRD